MNLRSLEDMRFLVTEVILPGARANFALHGQVDPASFVLAQHDPLTGQRLPNPQLTMIPLAKFAHDKDVLRAAQGAACKQLGALAHVYLTEGWMVEMDSDVPFEDPYAGGTASLADHPRRVEVICASLEHRDGSVSWSIPILRDGDKADLGETREHPGSWSGRMSGYVQQPGRRTEAEA